MSFSKRQKLIICIAVFALAVSVFPIFAVSDPINVDQQVTGEAICNNNGICETSLGENNENCPLDCPSSFPSGGGRKILPPIIYNLFISKITLNSATIEWKTNEPALCQLFWGRTQEHKEGVISEIAFSLPHKTEITDLAPETTYHFKIKCQNQRGKESETVDQRFTTLAPPDITPPANVSNFEAIPGNSQITLKWKNPPDFDFKAVRIMRSEKFYPEDPGEGKLVYEGGNISFVDTGLTNGIRYYYTVFSYDFAGNFSSGAVVSAVPRLRPPPPPEEITSEKECLEVGFYWYDDACYLEPKLVPAPPEVEKIKISDFDFIFQGKKLPLIGEKTIEVKTGEPLTISIDYEKVPEVLKTIMVTLEQPARNSFGIADASGDGKFFSFLLRINKEKTKYLATLMPPEDSGDYPLTITILDYKNQALKRIFGQLIVEKTEGELLPIPWYKKYQLYIYVLLVGMVMVGIILYLVKRKIAKPRKENR